jgi:hypothetical protein
LWKRFFWEVLLESRNTLFKREVEGKLLDGQMKWFMSSKRLFALVLFELWRREYGVII